MGPFNVLGSSQGDNNGTSLVFYYQLNTASNDSWVGAQLPISPGSDADLSSARAITIRLEGLGLTAATDVYIQIGSISEDLDGSGILKAKVSTAHTGFTFADQHYNVNMLVGAGPKAAGKRKARFRGQKRQRRSGLRGSEQGRNDWSERGCGREYPVPQYCSRKLRMADNHGFPE